MMAQLAEAGKPTLADVRDLEKTTEKFALQKKAERTRKPGGRAILPAAGFQPA
jgi:hypothetical protein